MSSPGWVSPARPHLASAHGESVRYATLGLSCTLAPACATDAQTMNIAVLSVTDPPIHYSLGVIYRVGGPTSPAAGRAQGLASAARLRGGCTSEPAEERRVT